MDLTMAEITWEPLSRLYLHPLNSRSEPPPAEIERLDRAKSKPGENSNELL
jgi:hypothetical protein